jgi:dTDP-4-dehydrorhamnose reductase
MVAPASGARRCGPTAGGWGVILVFGQTGQVARELALLAPEAVCLGRDKADLADPAACAAAIRAHAPRAVINAAAFTAVDGAEGQEALATTINGAAPAAMAKACAGLDIPLVQISTDYVFDGAGETPFAPDHPTAPLNAYGRSKLLGEEGVRAASCRHVILRTSWVFSAHGSNFVKTMLRLGAARDSLQVVADQIGGPTPAPAIAAACLRMAEVLQDAPALSGTYHFAGAPHTSWADFARAIMAEAGLACRIEDIRTEDYPTPARRPGNSRLDCAALARFGIAQPDWRQGLRAVLTEMKGT